MEQINVNEIIRTTLNVTTDTKHTSQAKTSLMLLTIMRHARVEAIWSRIGVWAWWWAGRTIYIWGRWIS